MAVILRIDIVGSFVFNGNLNEETYFQMLERNIVPGVRNLNINFEEIEFQQDGSPHIIQGQFRNFSVQIFLNGLFALEVP